MTDAQLVQRAGGLLAQFNSAGILEAADVHVALRLQQLGGATAEAGLLAIALAVRAVRLGSVCLHLEALRAAADAADAVDAAELPWPSVEEMVEALRASPLVRGGDRGPLRPLRLVDTEEGPLLYLARYYEQEEAIRRAFDRRATSRPPVDPARLAAGLDRYFNVDPVDREESATDRQRLAAAVALCGWTTVVTGGPGTGKTYTVARILALLFDQLGPQLRVGLAAPTGRAAAQLQAAIHDQTAALGLPTGLGATTLHRLLGWRADRPGRFRRDATNHLPHDVVIVDETSMVSLTLMSRLMEALRPQTRLILVGDPDQLTSVDAGAVLADLVARPTPPSLAPLPPALRALLEPDPPPARSSTAPQVVAADERDHPISADERRDLTAGIVRLRRIRRFSDPIAGLAAAIRAGAADDVLAILAGDPEQMSLHDPQDTASLEVAVRAVTEAVTNAARRGDAVGALRALGAHALLCAHRDGSRGVRYWSHRAAAWSLAPGEPVGSSGWLVGQPLLVTTNDYEAGVFNGDVGVVVSSPDGPRVAFSRGGTTAQLRPGRLSDPQLAYALTVHRSQGSQFDAVSVILPEQSEILSRELLYTAVTRARRSVRLFGTEQAVRAAVERPVRRASGLRRRPEDPITD